MTNKHGDFIWYELMTTDADGARDFYQELVGWNIEAAPSGPMDYRMISSETGPVAGLMPLTAEMQAGGAPSVWLGYVGVDDVDAMAKSYADGGGAVHIPPTDIPGVGRFAYLADPQGAMLYVMRGASDEESISFSYDKPRIGHCAWNELSTTDVEGAKHFYGQRFGWVKDGEMDMGPMGKYEFLRHAGRSDGSVMGQGMIGAVMPLMLPQPAWTHYFRVSDIDAAVAHIEANGGTITSAPQEIPGGDFSMNAIDPEGAHFALVGSRKE
jgi:uncharacterized protein